MTCDNSYWIRVRLQSLSLAFLKDLTTEAIAQNLLEQRPSFWPTYQENYVSTIVEDKWYLELDWRLQHVVGG